jgi:hypothetical protein
VIGGALVVLAALMAAAALLTGLRAAASESGPARAAALAGALLTAAVLFADDGRALRWSYGMGSAATRVELPGAGLLLGVTLLVTLAGTLLLGVAVLGSGAPPPVVLLLGRRALVLASGLGALSAGVLGWQISQLRSAVEPGAFDAWTIGGATAFLAAALYFTLAAPASDATGLAGRAKLLTSLAGLVALSAVLAAGVEAWFGSGAYLTPGVAATASAALMGFSARETTRLETLRRSLLLAALVLALAP